MDGICRGGGMTYSCEFRSRPSCVRSCPMARPETSGLSLRTVASSPASPHRSIGAIWSKGVFSAV